MTIFVEPGHVNEHPFNHARIIYGNATGAAVTATGADTDYPAALTLTDTTYERWKPAVSGDSITMTFNPLSANAIGIAAHSGLAFTLEVRQVGSPVFETVKMFRPDDGQTLSADFTEPDYGLIDYSPDNEAIMVLLKERQLTAVRITVTYTDNAPSIGVIRVGKVLEMARPFYQGHSPAMLSSDSVVRPNVSNSGEWLGASLIRQSRGLSLAWNNLKADWVRKYWNPFSNTLRTQPFFVAWNPLRFPSDCFYATATQTPKPTNSGPRDYQSITLAATAYSDGSDPVVESLGSKTFSELFDFERNSEATYYDVSGTLQTAGANTPRFTYDPVTLDAQGLLIEEARTNLFADTQKPTSASWNLQNVTVIENETLSLTGKLTGAAIVHTIASGFHYARPSTFSFSSGQSYTLTSFLKYRDWQYVNLLVDTTVSTNYVVFDLINGTITDGTYVDASIDSLSNGWFRCSLTFSAGATGTYAAFPCWLNNASSGRLPSYAGDGESGVYLFGVQIEAGSFKTSYMPSTETFTSRASTATFIDSNGAWQIAAVNAERNNSYGYDENGDLQYIGQLLEPARTNYLTYPRLIAPYGVWTFSRSTGYANVAVAPDGLLGASKLVEDTTASNTHGFLVDYTIGLGTFTTSIYMKAAERGLASVGMTDGVTATVYVHVNLSTGEYTLTPGGSWSGLTGSVVPAGNGWWRVSITAVRGAGTYTGVRVFTSTSLGSISHTGDGTSGIYVWGAQLEVGEYPTSLTPDATTFTSRAGSASYYDSNGVMQTAGTDVERSGAIAYGHAPDGTIVATDGVYEPSKTNDWVFSENLFLSGIGKTRVIIYPNQELGQTGGINASKLTADGTAANTHYATIVPTFAAGTVYTFSVYAKAAEFTNLALDLPSGQFGSIQRALFDLTDGTVSFPNGNNLTHYGSQPVGDGWYRIWITSTCTSSGVGAALLLLFDNDGNVVFDGDYNSGVYVWGVQIETGSYPSSYIYEGTIWNGRASTATYYDANGVIQTASSGVGRNAAYYPLDGVFYPIDWYLFESASTNQLLYSEQLDNAVWGKAQLTVTANAAVSPDGNTTADKIIQDSSAGTLHGITQPPSFSAGNTYAFSIYAKAAEMDKLELLFSGTSFGSNKSAVFDLTNKTISAGINATADRSGLDDLGNGWFRCWVSDTATTTSVVANAGVYLIDAAGNRNFDGDGASGLYVWGAQLESYSPAAYTAYYATSYIPTTSSTVTRAADGIISGAVTRAADITSSPSVTRSADVYTSTALARDADLCTRTPGIEFNKSAFTVYVEATFRAVQANNIMLFDASSGGLNRDRVVLYRTTSGNITAFISDTTGDSSFVIAQNATGELPVKIAMSYDAETGVLICAANGVSNSTTKILSFGSPDPDTFHFGTQWDDGNVANRPIKNLKIYPVALSATELEALTA